MLKTDYKNDSLDVSMGGKRRYEMTENADGTVTLTDKTTYSEVGDNFGATEINAITTEVNTVSNNLTTLGNTVNDMKTYSTTEQIIGKWIDGSNLYRKVIELPSMITVSNSSWTTVDGVDVSDIGLFINVSTFNQNKTIWYCSAGISTSTGKLLLQAQRNDTSVTVKYLVFEYIKKTNN